ncbi:MAG: hypothetical protein EHM35_08415, partial [Planctomycetaceae bacterium]
MSTMSQVQNPYPGPRPFAVGELFFGRERELAELSQLSAIEQVVVLYGGRGSGKTSLVRAGLIPAMRSEGYDVLPLGRVSGQPAALSGEPRNVFLANLLESLDRDCHDPALLTQMSLNDWLQAYKNPSCSSGEPSTELEGSDELRLLIIDQFEEIFTVYPERWSERDAFFRELGTVLGANPLLSVILCLREEYLAQLDPYDEFVPGRLRVRYRIDPMGPEAALLAVRGPAEAAGRAFAPGVAERLVDSLRQISIQQADGTLEVGLGQHVDLFQLQLVCQRLWSSLPAGAQEVCLEDPAAIGDVASVIQAFYEGAIGKSLAEASADHVSERKLRSWIEYELISETGTRTSYQLGYETTADVPNPLVYSLIDDHLLRLEVHSGTRSVELTSDCFVEPIRGSNRDWFAANRDELVEAAKRWDGAQRPDGVLLTGPGLARARRLAKTRPGDYGSLEKEFLKRSIARARRRRAMSAGGTVLALALIVLTLLAGLGYEVAETERGIAAANNLAAQALLVQSQKPELGLLLAVEAAKALPSGQDVPPAVPSALQELLASIGGVPLAGHDRSVSALAFSPGWAWFASGSEDGNVIVWDGTTGQVVKQLSRHEAAILDVAVSPDGRYLATASGDGTARLLDVESDNLRILAG